MIMNNIVSVVTICFNAADIIEGTIKSVISQSYPNVEYIIVDGGSTDGTIDIIRKYEDKIASWVSEKDNGIYDAMNKGIRKASGKWLNFMNAGDSFCSGTVIEDIISKIDEDTIIAYGNTILKYDLGERLATPSPIEGIIKGMVFGHQATFIDSQYHKSHLYDTTFRSSGDYNFFYQSYFAGVKFQYIPVNVARYEAQGGMSSSSGSWVIVAQENARIWGIDKTVRWRIVFALIKLNIGAREWLKKALPNSVVDVVKQYHFNNIGKNTDNE